MKHYIILFLLSSILFGQSVQIPKSYSNLTVEEGEIILKGEDGKIYKLYSPEPKFKLNDFLNSPKGDKDGIQFDFNNKNLNGILYYGFIEFTDGKFPQPVFFKKPSSINEGVASINIRKDLRGKYDMIGWEKSGKGTMGYRVVDDKGNLIYDGRVNFLADSEMFNTVPTVVDGPFVNLIESNSVVISFMTDKEIKGSVKVGEKVYESENGLNHEIKIDGLTPSTKYTYEVSVGKFSEQYTFKTAPEKGSKMPFVFAYASDSRHAQGGGERNIYGANGYIMKRIVSLCMSKEVSFMQFTGDLIDGYLTNLDETDLQYANWKNSIKAFTHHFPIYKGMGNHEALNYIFTDGKKSVANIDKFPFENKSAEYLFAKNFVNPINGPISEDGSKYDPDLNNVDFPSYDENVFYYVYDNVAVIVLNSNYWYAPGLTRDLMNDNINVGGNLHGYLMDNQLKWLEEVLMKFEADDDIDHIFTTQHTPIFPNGGHVGDDMWYNGNNDPRPIIAGEKVNKGIIERRDEYLDLLVNKSSKVRAVLTGDEHNYNRMKLTKNVNIYPENWDKGRIEISREIYQVNNGAAGAPYYAQELTPWSDSVEGFTTRNALVLFHVDGKSIEMKVYNPDTLELIDELKMN